MKKPLLHELFVLEIQDLYDAEQQILDALPKMEEAATHEDLVLAFSKHMEETEEQVSRLEKIAADLDFDIEGETCEAMEGLITEGEEAIEMDAVQTIKDLALIGAARRVENYEHAAYDVATMLAKAMGHDDAAKMLEQNQKEEDEADDVLSKAADKIVSEIED